MIETIPLQPGVTLHCWRDRRFRQGGLSVQLVRRMQSEEAARNALLPALLLRGTRTCPDLRAITLRLDDLYGASISPMVQRIGDHQTTGFYCGFMEDRFALPGDRVFAPLADFLKELLREPALEQGVFREDYVEGEKKNLISTMESERNDKRVYAAAQLLRLMCREDPYGLPRLGTPEAVAAIDGPGLFAHYRRLLAESRVHLFYVGSWEAEAVAELLGPVFSRQSGQPAPLPPQTAFRDGGPQERTEEMPLAQSRLEMGFLSPVTLWDPDYIPMRVLSVVLGEGMTSKLFLNVRERRSLCYEIGSTYHSAKGILTVSAGIDASQVQTVRQEVLAQLAACQKGEITQEELEAAQEALLSSLRGVHDSPGSIERYYGTQILREVDLPPQTFGEGIARVRREDLVRAANCLKLHTVYFLKGVAQ